MRIQYETAGGMIRKTPELMRVGTNKSKTASLFVTIDPKNQRTYEWYWQGAIDGRLVDDVLRVNSKKSCSRLLGSAAKYIETTR